MKIRLIPYLAIFLAMAMASAQGGQSEPASNEELANARAMLQEGRDAIIREELRLTSAEESEFWDLYAEYRADMQPIQDRYVALVGKYLRQYESGILTNEFAADMLDEYFDVKSDILRTRKRYISRFARIVPMLKVARFYQLENKFNADVDAELALLVPLVESE